MSSEFDQPNQLMLIADRHKWTTTTVKFSRQNFLTFVRAHFRFFFQRKSPLWSSSRLLTRFSFTHQQNTYFSLFLAELYLPSIQVCYQSFDAVHVWFYASWYEKILIIKLKHCMIALLGRNGSRVLSAPRISHFHISRISLLDWSELH